MKLPAAKRARGTMIAITKDRRERDKSIMIEFPSTICRKLYNFLFMYPVRVPYRLAGIDSTTSRMLYQNGIVEHCEAYAGIARF
jgi:hypothetical protein